MEWKSYTNDRLIAQHPTGFYVIIPKNIDEVQPLFCPVCSYIMKSSYDEESYSEFECCDSCSSEWARRNKDSWKSGWRPSHEEIKTAILKRNLRDT